MTTGARACLPPAHETILKHAATSCGNIGLLGKRHAGLDPSPKDLPMYLSPKFFALPLAALAVIIALSQAHSQNPRSTEVTLTVHRATNCATPTSTFNAACAIAHNDSATFVR